MLVGVGGGGGGIGMGVGVGVGVGVGEHEGAVLGFVGVGEVVVVVGGEVDAGAALEGGEEGGGDAGAHPACPALHGRRRRSIRKARVSSSSSVGESRPRLNNLSKPVGFSYSCHSRFFGLQTIVVVHKNFPPTRAHETVRRVLSTFRKSPHLGS